MQAPAYLQGDDIAAYCSDDAACRVSDASRLIDGYLKRRQGLLWMPDFRGCPAYMARATPDCTLNIVGQVEAGRNIVVTLTGGDLQQDMVGMPVVLDRNKNGATETCVITAVSRPASQIALDLVQNVHLDGATVDFGLQIVEERPLPDGRSITRVSQRPIARLVAGSGRFTYGRRSSQMFGNYLDEPNLLADLSQLGGSPAWMPFDTNEASTSSNGEIFVPVGIYLYPFNEVRVFYISGWSYKNLPEAIKEATGIVANDLCNSTIPRQLKSFKSGPIASERFSSSNFDADTKMLLEPYRARAFV
jgi:hypothetical protein